MILCCVLLAFSSTTNDAMTLTQLHNFRLCRASARCYLLHPVQTQPRIRVTQFIFQEPTVCAW